MEDDEDLLVDDDEELGNPENMQLFAEFKVREAGLDDWATKIRDDQNLSPE